MSGDEYYHLRSVDSPEYPEDYRGTEHLESASCFSFESPVRATAPKEEFPTIPAAVAKPEESSATKVAVKTEPEVKREWDESWIPVTIKVESGLKEEMKEEVKEEIKEEPLPEILLPSTGLSDEEHEEEVEMNGPKMLRARQRIESIRRRVDPQTPQMQLFKKFKRLICSGNCQGPVIDAIWDEWQDFFPANWTSYHHRVHRLRAKMYEERHYYERKAAW